MLLKICDTRTSRALPVQDDGVREGQVRRVAELGSLLVQEAPLYAKLA